MKNLFLVPLILMLFGCSPVLENDDNLSYYQKFFKDNPCNEVINGQRLLKVTPQINNWKNVTEVQQTMMENPSCEIVDIKTAGLGSNYYYFVVYK